jgi:Protein of unknown function (DUF1571)
MAFQSAFRRFAIAGALSASICSATSLWAVQDDGEVRRTTEPVFRVARVDSPAPVQEPVHVAENTLPAASSVVPAALPSSAAALLAATPVSSAESTAPAPHPLDSALELAHNGLAAMRENIRDYNAILVKRECVDGVIGDANYMRIKIRNPRTSEDGSTVPFSVYMKFLKPKNVSGREVIYVEGQNDNKLIAHETGIITGMKTFHLDPSGWLAMKGNRHPITEAGLENLVIKLIEKAERDKAAGQCKVDYRQGAKINGRTCTMIEVIHDEKRAPYEFHKAQVFIDDELQIPIRYSAWDWPPSPGAESTLIEEYTYVQVEINVGLTDADFDPLNEEYAFPGR